MRGRPRRSRAHGKRGGAPAPPRRISSTTGDGYSEVAGDHPSMPALLTPRSLRDGGRGGGNADRKHLEMVQRRGELQVFLLRVRILLRVVLGFRLRCGRL